jgi:hypothetical protein
MKGALQTTVTTYGGAGAVHPTGRVLKDVDVPHLNYAPCYALTALACEHKHAKADSWLSSLISRSNLELCWSPDQLRTRTARFLEQRALGLARDCGLRRNIKDENDR